MVVSHSSHVSKVCCCNDAVNVSPANDSQGAKTETALKILHRAQSLAALLSALTQDAGMSPCTQ